MSFEGNKPIIIKDLSGNIAPTFLDNMISVFLQCSSGSGGVALTTNTSSMPFGIIIKNAGSDLGVSGVVLVGSSGSPPYESGGFMLSVGDTVKIDGMSRPDYVRVYGFLSGCAVTWIGVY